MKRGSAGVSLLELTIVLAIFATVAGAVFIGTSASNADQRNLQNAAVRLQADMRYAQRRAVTEGQRIGVRFDTVNNRYFIIVTGTNEILRTVYTDVNLFSVNYPQNTVSFLPRGTATPGTIMLRNGRLQLPITTTLSGGQVRIGYSERF
ncbi:MAG: GspH/FimT family pseudopilin [Defluviitaleaceae bacterium]|nr:GspH/FimT family pseudopilin [Defluviitaleaceae bacterium]